MCFESPSLMLGAGGGWGGVAGALWGPCQTVPAPSPVSPGFGDLSVSAHRIGTPTVFWGKLCKEWPAPWRALSSQELAAAGPAGHGAVREEAVLLAESTLRPAQARRQGCKQQLGLPTALTAGRPGTQPPTDRRALWACHLRPGMQDALRTNNRTPGNNGEPNKRSGAREKMWSTHSLCKSPRSCDDGVSQRDDEGAGAAMRAGAPAGRPAGIQGQEGMVLSTRCC